MAEEKKAKGAAPHEESHKKPHEKEIEAIKDRYYRALADLDNLKKRSVIEREEIIAFANETLIGALLPIIDSFDRAFDSLQKLNASDEIIKGLALIKKQFEDVLTRCGVSEIDASGKPYDPNFHEAIMKKKSGDVPEGDVLEVAQKGYMLHSRVLRPAMVIISEK